LGLFLVLSQPVTGFIPAIDIFPPCAYPPVSSLISWTAVHVFGIHAPLVFVGSGSGDKVSDWIFHFLILVIAIVATPIWSILDRRRDNYDDLAKWFRLFVRFALAGQLLGYGFAKFFPLQMPFPHLTRLLEPYGNFSPMGVLWSSIGAAPSYEIFAGAAEILAGVLLIFPRTALLGALVSLADMTQVFMLNMTYDVPVKIFSFHLLLLSLYLLAPQAQRLFDFFILSKNAAPWAAPQLLRGTRANRIAFVAQIVLGVYLLGANLSNASSAWNFYGGGSPKSVLYGIWDVMSLEVNGKMQPPLVTDPRRYRRVVFDSPTVVSFQQMDDTIKSYSVTSSVSKKTLLLTDAKDKKWKAQYAYEREGPSRLKLDGIVDKLHVRMRLALVDRNNYLLVSRGFNWVQDYPVNR
jgi:hypothetical protein